MIHLSATPYRAAQEQASAERRMGLDSRAFWIVFAVEAALVLGIIAVLVSFIPRFAPLATANDYDTVYAAVTERLNGTIVDPLVSVAPGVTVRSSNLRGFELNGVTYYYALGGEQGYDPLSRGIVNEQQIDVVLRDTSGPEPLTIYRLR